MDFFSTYLGKLAITFLISTVPVVELRGAIPFGVGIGLDVWTVSIIAIIGNTLPTPFIILFVRRIFEWMRSKSDKLNRLVVRLEAKADKHKAKVTRYEFWGLCLFVAIPLPGTGAWTGALIASMLEMRLKDAIPSIFLGVVIAAVIMGLSSYFVATGVNLLFF